MENLKNQITKFEHKIKEFEDEDIENNDLQFISKKKKYIELYNQIKNDIKSYNEKLPETNKKLNEIKLYEIITQTENLKTTDNYQESYKKIKKIMEEYNKNYQTFIIYQ